MCVQQNRLIAAKLQILCAFPHGNPHEGIEPAHSTAEYHEEFVCAVTAADMNNLMAED